MSSCEEGLATGCSECSSEEALLHASQLPCNKLFVYNLAKEVTDRDLQPLFAPFKPVYANVALGKKGTSRRFGFVLFNTASDAERASKALKGRRLHGKEIEIKSATAPEPTSDKRAAATEAKQRLAAKEARPSEQSWTIPAKHSGGAEAVLNSFPPLPRMGQRQPSQDGTAASAAEGRPSQPAAARPSVPAKPTEAPPQKPKTMFNDYRHPETGRAVPVGPPPPLQQQQQQQQRWPPLDPGAAWNPLHPATAHMHPQQPYEAGPPPQFPGFGLQPPAGEAPPGRRVLLVHHGVAAHLPAVADAFMSMGCTSAQLSAEGHSAFEFLNAAEAEAAMLALDGREVAGAVLSISMVVAQPPTQGPPPRPYGMAPGPQLWHVPHAPPPPMHQPMRPPPLCSAYRPFSGPMGFNGMQHPPPPPPGPPPGFPHPSMQPFQGAGPSMPPPRPPGPPPPPPPPRPAMPSTIPMPVPLGQPTAAHHFRACRPPTTLNAAAPEFTPAGSPRKAGQPSPSEALAWLHGCVLAALEGRDCVLPVPLPGMPASRSQSPGTPRAPTTDWSQEYAAFNPFNLELIFVGRRLMRQLMPVETGLIQAAPANVKPVSVLKGALVRVLIDKMYSLRLITDTQLDSEGRLMLSLNDLPHLIQADRISNCCPMSKGVKEGEAISDLGRRELLELHARVAFRGLRMTRMEVAQVAWRLSAASRFSSDPDQQRAEQELRWAFEDEEGVSRLAELVEAVDAVEEAQILHAAFSLPLWQETATWTPSLPANQTPAAKPAGASAAASTPGTIELRTRSWLGSLLSFQPSAAEAQHPLSAECVQAAAQNLMALFPMVAGEVDSLDLGLLSLAAEAGDGAYAEVQQDDPTISQAVVPEESFLFGPVPELFLHGIASATPNSCGFVANTLTKGAPAEGSRLRAAGLSPTGVSKQLPFTGVAGGGAGDRGSGTENDMANCCRVGSNSPSARAAALPSAHI